MLNSCSFINNLPNYVLDRTILINGHHKHLISGYKLAKASQTLRGKLIELRKSELEKYQQKYSNKIEKIKIYNENKNKREDEEECKIVQNDLNVDQFSSHHYGMICSMSLDNLNNDPLIINYPDLYGLECVLSFVHCEPNTQILINRLNPTSAKAMLQAGIDFQVNYFITHCIELIQKDLNFKNCWRYWQVGKQFSTELPEFLNHLLNYIMIHFVEAGQLEEFLDLDLDDFEFFLKCNELNCSDELDLFKLIQKWILFDKQKREFHFESLLKCLRLGCLKPNQLSQIMESDLMQKNSNLNNFISFILSNLKINDLLSTEETDLYHYFNSPRLPHLAIFVVGGWEGNQNDSNFGPSKAIQVYNSLSNNWTRFESSDCSVSLNEGHAYSGCVVYGNRIFVIGGYLSNCPTQTLKTFEIENSTWKFLSPMHERRNYVCVCLLDNKIYAMGGHNGKHRLNSVECYDIQQNYWSFIAPMRQVRSDAGADSLDGQIYVVGGFDGHRFFNSVEMYNPQTNQWTNVAPMTNIRSGAGIISINQYLFAIGGNDGLQRLRTVERFDPQLNQWQMMPSMNRQRSNFCVTNLNDVIYVIGGWSDESNSTISVVEKWTPDVFQTWENVQELFLPASANCCCTVHGLHLIKKYLKLNEFK